MNQRLVSLGLLWLVACGGDPKTGDSGAATIDLRRSFPTPDADTLAWVTPEYKVPGYTEVQYCLFGTYTGPDVAIVGQDTYQSLNGHHIVLMGTKADPDDYPDGKVFDCTSTESLPMADMDPIYIADIGIGSTDAEPTFSSSLPAGVGVELEEGTRYVLQSHYLNATPDEILVQDAIYLHTQQPDSIENWAAPIVNVQSSLDLPPGQESNVTFDCTWEQELNILYVGGHMHEWGTAFSLTETKGGVTETLYDIPVWDPVYRDAPPMNNYDESAPHTVQPGDVWTTSCTWFNTEDYALAFPSEMCVTFGMAWPTKVAIICDAS